LSRRRLRWQYGNNPEYIVSVLVILLLAYAIAAFLRECDLLERAWHALGDASPREGTYRWTDANL
jgi:hypothetical protein